MSCSHLRAYVNENPRTYLNTNTNTNTFFFFILHQVPHLSDASRPTAAESDSLHPNHEPDRSNQDQGPDLHRDRGRDGDGNGDREVTMPTPTPRSIYTQICLHPATHTHTHTHTHTLIPLGCHDLHSQHSWATLSWRGDGEVLAVTSTRHGVTRLRVYGCPLGLMSTTSSSSSSSLVLEAVGEYGTCIYFLSLSLSLSFSFSLSLFLFLSLSLSLYFSFSFSS